VVDACRVTGNEGYFGGGIYCTSGAAPTVTNCILWGNGSEVVNVQSFSTVSRSIVEGGHPGTGNMDTDPLFLIGSYRLSACSPAIDAGDNTANGTAWDVAGNPRKMASFGITALIDLGAYELQGCPTDTPNTWTGNGDGQLWSDPANWDKGAVPCGCHNVLVPTGNDVTVPAGTDGLGRTLDVELGAQLITAPTGKIKIGGE
jgi:hypothetical protein